MNESLDLRSVKTVVELLRARAERTPHRVALSFLQDDGVTKHAVSYSELQSKAQAVAAKLQQAGQHGKPVLILMQPSLAYIYALFACWYCGAIAVPIYTPRKNASLDRVTHIVGVTGADTCLTTSDIQNTFADEASGSSANTPKIMGLRCVLVNDVTEALPNHLDYQPYQPNATTTALLQFTSGSTAAPKGVQLEHRQLLANTAVITTAMNCTEQSIGVSWLPPFHDMGLVGGILQPIYAGYPMHHMAPVTFLKRPLRWLEAVSREKATITVAPNFAYALCTEKIRPEQLAHLDLSSLKVVANGAEPIQLDTLKNFAEKFAVVGFDKRAFLPCYGMAEATLFITGRGYFEGWHAVPASREKLTQGLLAQPINANDTRQLVSSGKPGVGVQIAIVDPHTGKVLPEGQVGEIYAQSSSNSLCYWRRLDASRSTFENTLAGREGLWLKTEDLGFIHESELFVTGRIKDVIIVHGENHYPYDIENTLRQQVAALADAQLAVFGHTTDAQESVVVVVEQRRAPTEEQAAAITLAVRSAVSQYHQLHVHSVHFVPASTIPTTSSGKLQRLVLKQTWLQGELRAHALKEMA